MHVYYLAPGATELVRATSDLVQPNGVVGTPDGATLYVADPGASRIYRYTVGPDGALADKAVFAERGADGMTLDERGNVYLANANRIWVHDPSGALLESIAVPENPSNVTFGGADGRTLFITARTSLYAIDMAVAGAARFPSPPGSATPPAPGASPTVAPTDAPTELPTAAPTEPPEATPTAAPERWTIHLPVGRRD